MSCETETVKTLRESGYRLTPQRMLVTSVVRHAGEHLTASEIFERVQESYPYVDISTVYRTLSVLRQLGLVSETSVGGGDSTYEWLAAERHHHLICRICGSVASLERGHVENLGAEIMDEYGFRPDLDHFVISGVCRDCDEAAKTG